MLFEGAVPRRADTSQAKNGDCDEDLVHEGSAGTILERMLYKAPMRIIRIDRNEVASPSRR